jgi:hypothetical protein
MPCLAHGTLLKATIYFRNLSPKMQDVLFYHDLRGIFQVRGGVRFIDCSCSLSLIEFPDLCSNSGRYGMHVAKFYF